MGIVTQYAWYRSNRKDVLFQVHIICNDLHLKPKRFFYNKCCHLNCWGLFQTANKMYMFSSWLFSVRGGLPASWPTHHISLTGYHWYHLSTTTNSTICGTPGAVLLWLYIRRPQAVSFNLWHDVFFPSYKNAYTYEINFGKHFTTFITTLTVAFSLELSHVLVIWSQVIHVVVGGKVYPVIFPATSIIPVNFYLYTEFVSTD